jgi:hypothetical protein
LKKVVTKVKILLTHVSHKYKNVAAHLWLAHTRGDMVQKSVFEMILFCRKTGDFNFRILTVESQLITLNLNNKTSLMLIECWLVLCEFLKKAAYLSQSDPNNNGVLVEWF